MSAPADLPSSIVELRAEVDEHRRRITELEVEAAFRRKTIDDLDEVLQAQAKQIHALERRLSELLTMVGPDDELPDI